MTSFYIGPYIKCTRSIKISVEQEHFGCTNKKCEYFHKKMNNNSKFCPQCGKELGAFKDKVHGYSYIYLTDGNELGYPDNLSFKNLMKELNIEIDDITNINSDNHKPAIWIDNRSKYGKYVNFDRGDIVDITSFNVSDKKLKTFTDKFKPLLDALVERYGNKFEYSIETGMVCIDY